MQEHVSDKLDLYQRSFIGLWVLIIGLGGLMCISSLFVRHSVPDEVLDLVEQFDLTVLSLVPSGQLLRTPETRHPGVDLRMVPDLPSVRVDSANLLLHME